jgi:P-type conjugative transfer protein TrbJ
MFCGRKVTRHIVLSVVCLLFLGVATPRRADAQLATYCENCSDWWDQLTQEIYENSTMIQTAQSLATQLQQLQAQLNMAKITPTQAFSRVSGIMNNLNQVSQGGQALSYAMGNLDNQFTANYAKVGYAPTTSYATRYSQWSATSLDTTQKALDVANLQSQNQSGESDLITNLQSQAQSADAAVSTVQVGNQVAAEELNQLMQLRQLMMSDMSSKAAFQAQQIKEHDEAAALGGMVQASGPSITDVNTAGSTLNGTN